MQIYFRLQRERQCRDLLGSDSHARAATGELQLAMPTFVFLLMLKMDLAVNEGPGVLHIHGAVVRHQDHPSDFRVVQNAAEVDLARTPRKYVFDVTSVGQRSSWTCNSVKVEIKLHLECKYCFLCARFMLRQMRRTNLSVGIEVLSSLAKS